MSVRYCATLHDAVPQDGTFAGSYNEIHDFSLKRAIAPIKGDPAAARWHTQRQIASTATFVSAAKLTL